MAAAAASATAAAPDPSPFVASAAAAAMSFAAVTVAVTSAEPSPAVPAAWLPDAPPDVPAPGAARLACSCSPTPFLAATRAARNASSDWGSVPPIALAHSKYASVPKRGCVTLALHLWRTEAKSSRVRCSSPPLRPAVKPSTRLLASAPVLTTSARPDESVVRVDTPSIWGEAAEGSLSGTHVGSHNVTLLRSLGESPLALVIGIDMLNSWF